MPFTISRCLSIARLISVGEKPGMSVDKFAGAWILPAITFSRPYVAGVSWHYPVKQFATPDALCFYAIFQGAGRESAIDLTSPKRNDAKDFWNSVKARSVGEQVKLIAWTVERDRVRKLGPIEKKEEGGGGGRKVARTRWRNRTERWTFLPCLLVSMLSSRKQRPLRRGRTSSCDRRWAEEREGRNCTTTKRGPGIVTVSAGGGEGGAGETRGENRKTKPCSREIGQRYVSIGDGSRRCDFLAHGISLIAKMQHQKRWLRRDTLYIFRFCPRE